MDYSSISPALKDVLTAIRHRKSVDEVVGLILDRACQLADAVHGSFITIDEGCGTLVVTSTHGPDWTDEKMVCRLRVGEGITGRVAQTGIPYLCRDTLRDPAYYPLFDYIRSELAVPVFVGERVWGIINLDGLRPHAFDTDTLNTLSVFAELTAFAITLRLELNEQKRLQQQLVQQEKLASLGETIAGLAHEINNPITSILGHAALMQIGRGKEADDRAVKAILSEGRRIADLVGNLLAFSRRESVRREVVGINDIVARTCGMRAYALRLSNIRLEQDLEPVSYPVKAQAHQIQQVLLNLINNGEQAIGSDRADGCIRITTKREGEMVRLSVTDNGSGIPAQIRESIFEPFFTTKQLGEGTGLGLSIAQSIAEAHGGSISLEPAVPGETTFSLNLPLARSPDTPEPEAVAAKEDDGATLRASVDAAAAKPTKGRVLVVDDEPFILDSIGEYLRMMGLQCTTVLDARKGMDLLTHQRFHAVITDIRMPGMDGAELYQAVCAVHPEYRERFIFMTGDVVRRSTQAFIQDVPCTCLEKPFAFDALFRTISPLLPGNDDDEEEDEAGKKKVDVIGRALMDLPRS